MAQPLCSKLMKSINSNNNSRKCCQQLKAAPYREFSFQDVLRRYQSSSSNLLSIGKRFGSSLIKQRSVVKLPTKKIKGQNCLEVTQINGKSKDDFLSKKKDQNKFQRQQKEQDNNKQSKQVNKFQINLNRKIKIIKPIENSLLESNNRAQIQQPVSAQQANPLEAQIQNQQKKFNFNNLQQIVKSQDYQCQKKQSELQIVKDQFQIVRQKKQRFWEDQHENQHELQNKSELSQNQCQIQENQVQLQQNLIKPPFKLDDQKRQNLQQQQEIIQIQNKNIIPFLINYQAFQNDCYEEKQQKNQIIDQQIKISPIFQEQQEQIYQKIGQNKQYNQQNCMDIENTINAGNQTKEQSKVTKQIFNDKLVCDLIVVHKNKKQASKDQIIITRAQQKQLHLLNKLSLRLLKQKYGQQKTIQELTSKILQNEKSYHIQAILCNTKNRIINQLTLAQKKSIIDKYLSEQQESFKLHIR